MTYYLPTIRPNVHLRLRRAAAILAATVALGMGVPAHAVDKAPAASISKAPGVETGNLSGLKLRLVGVINSENHPKALVAVDGVEDEMLVGEGDFLGGYTLESIGDERIELARGTERQTVTMQHLRWIHADAKAKTMTPKPAADPSGPPSRRDRSEIMVASASGRSSSAASSAATAAVIASSASAASSGRPSFQIPITGPVTSPFGLRDRPVIGNGVLGSRYHQGVDIAGSEHGTVRASASGTVTVSQYSLGSMGNYVEIEHSGGYTTRYYHLEKRLVQRGQTVKAGQAVGLEGRTGDVTGPHLHFEIRKDGTALDPSRFLPALKE